MAFDYNEYERRLNEYRLKSRYRDSDQEPDNSNLLLILVIMIVSIYLLIFKGC